MPWSLRCPPRLELLEIWSVECNDGQQNYKSGNRLGFHIIAVYVLDIINMFCISTTFYLVNHISKVWFISIHNETWIKLKIHDNQITDTMIITLATQMIACKKIMPSVTWRKSNVLIIDTLVNDSISPRPLYTLLQISLKCVLIRSHFF